MHELDTREKRMRGLSAANDAVNAIKEMLTVKSAEKRSYVAAHNESGDDQLKGHRLTVVDKVVGTGSRMGRIIVALLVVAVVVTFLKINFLISEIPNVVEKKIKVVDALGGVSAGGAVLVSSGSNAAAASPISSVEDARLIKTLRGEIDGLKVELEEYKKIVQDLRAAQPVSTMHAVVDQDVTNHSPEHSKVRETGDIREPTTAPEQSSHESHNIGGVRVGVRQTPPAPVVRLLNEQVSGIVRVEPNLRGQEFSGSSVHEESSEHIGQISINQ
jgi:hypothetical protein